MHAKKWALGCSAGAFLALSGVLFLQWQTAQRLRAEADGLRRESQTLAQLRTENHRLAEQQPSAEEMQRLQADHEALLRLRRELEALKNRPSESTRAPATPPEPPKLVPASEWKNAGKITPAAALESVLWAAARGDIDALVGGLDFRASRAELDALFAGLPAETRAQYGSPEKAFATLLAAQIAPAVGAMAVSAERKMNNPKVELISLSARLASPDGTPRQRSFLFIRADDGWRMAISDMMVKSYATLLNGAPTMPLPAAAKSKTGG